jgi:hypothetical protein
VVLNFYGAADDSYRARELGQNAVAGRFDQPPLITLQAGLDYLAPNYN